MAALEAEDEIAAGDVPDQRVYDLVLAATGSKDRAGEALAARIAERLKRNEKPNV